MVVAETVKTGSDNTNVVVHLAGTIAEVLQALANANARASKIVYYSEASGNAVAVYTKGA